MRLTQISLANPAAVAIVAAVIVMLGAVSMFNIPAQLLPQIEKPVVSVDTAWPGASPKEIESELVVPIEEVLQGTPGMTEMVSWSLSNFGWMQLEFALETDMTRTLIEIISRLNRLRPLPANAERTIELNEAPSAVLARRYVGSRGYMYVGRGITYPAALEGALKLKEVSYVHAEGYAAGELKHGPISLLDAEVPLVAVATRTAVHDKLVSNLMEGRARDARVIAVVTEGDDRMKAVADDILWVPPTVEMLSPILAIVPLQLFAYHTALERGTDIDQPRNLAKSVTVE